MAEREVEKGEEEGRERVAWGEGEKGGKGRGMEGRMRGGRDGRRKGDGGVKGSRWRLKVPHTSVVVVWRHREYKS